MARAAGASAPGGPAMPGRALVIGTGLVGGSLGLALRARGWEVRGWDADPGRTREAVGLGAIDEAGDDPRADVAFVATPSSAVAAVAHGLFHDVRREKPIVVTDVAGVKAPVVAAVRHPRFVGGHPMAGSEQVGLEGADAELFSGALWVLSPVAGTPRGDAGPAEGEGVVPATDLAAFSLVRGIVASLGSDVVALSPEDHDRLVATVSHVPHLVAATLMNAASEDAEQDAVLLRLAAGGFRDMTRVAAGHPGIWPDLCADNSAAIVRSLERVIADLSVLRDRIDSADRAGLLEVLERASAARRHLPARGARPERLTEVRLPVPDREGVLAEITGAASDLGVNIYDIEIAHSPEGPMGVLVLVVEGSDAPKLGEELRARGHRSTSQALS